MDALAHQGGTLEGDARGGLHEVEGIHGQSPLVSLGNTAHGRAHRQVKVRTDFRQFTKIGLQVTSLRKQKCVGRGAARICYGQPRTAPLRTPSDRRPRYPHPESVVGSPPSPLTGSDIALPFRRRCLLRKGREPRGCPNPCRTCEILLRHSAAFAVLTQSKVL